MCIASVLCCRHRKDWITSWIFQHWRVNCGDRQFNLLVLVLYQRVTRGEGMCYCILRAWGRLSVCFWVSGVGGRRPHPTLSTQDTQTASPRLVYSQIKVYCGNPRCNIIHDPLWGLSGVAAIKSKIIFIENIWNIEDMLEVFLGKKIA